MRSGTVTKGKSSLKASLFLSCFMTAEGMSLLAGSTPPNTASPSVPLIRVAADSVHTVDENHRERLSDVHTKTRQSAATAGVGKRIWGY